MTSLQDLGWNSFFKEQWRAEIERRAVPEGSVPARAAEEQKGVWQIRAGCGEMWAHVAGRLRHQAHDRADLPAIGDWLAITARPNEGWATIHFILPRRSKFSRRVAGRRTEEQIVAANMDTVFLVSSLNREFNLRRIERYLTLVWESGAQPVVVLNKADLCPDPASWVNDAETVALGVPVHATSALTGQGMEALHDHLGAGQTAALVGSSGVGKSTIINRLLGQSRQRVGPVRDADDRGRHTTASRQLLLVPGGGLLIDTPGMREIQLWDSAEGMEHAFADVEGLADQCRFADCRHATEPGCAVRDAVAEEKLTAARLENYRKLEREEAFLERKRDAGAQAEERKRWKRIHKEMRRHYKES